MKMSVVVDDAETFEKWKASQDSWLKQNPSYLEKVPANLREAAMIKAGIPVSAGDAATQSSTTTVTGSN
jgi:cytochrome c oxidase subunit 2